MEPSGLAGQAVVRIFDAVQQTARSKGWFAASALVGRSLRDDRKLHSRERRYVGDTVFAMLRKQRRLRALCGGKNPSGQAIYAAFLVDEQTAHSDAELDALSRFLRSAGLSLPDVKVRRQDIEQRFSDIASASPDAQATLIGEALSYPDWLTSLFVSEFGLAQAIAILHAQNGRARLTLRANTLRCSRDELCAKLHALGIAAEPTPFSPWGVVLDTHLNVYSLPLHQEGFCEVQDEASQLVTELCAPPPGGLVIDACAGAGGKTLGLSAMMGNRGRILAFDIDDKKLSELKQRARRAGLTNIETRCLREDGLLHLVPERICVAGAQRVLVDATCSGLGVLRRNPESRWRLTPGDIDEITVKQR